MFSELFRRILIISPHADDEILGCGGLMARTLAEVPSSHILVTVLGTATVTNSETGRQVTAAEREQELAQAISILSECSSCGSRIEHTVLYSGMELQLDTIGTRRIVSDLDNIVSFFRPTAALVCYASHHQDHQITERAAVAAMRPSPSNRISFRGLYEYGYLEGWCAGNHVRLSKMYVDISRYFSVKLRSFQAYRSQQRPDPRDVRSVQSVETLAKTRGIEAGVPYAEAFFPLSVTL